MQSDMREMRLAHKAGTMVSVITKNISE